MLTIVPAVLAAASLEGAEIADPTLPALAQPAPQASVTAAAAEMSWNLTMVKLTPSSRVAMLNGRLVRVGDLIEDFEVAEIGPRAIVLERNGNPIRVALLEAAVKSPAPRRGREAGRRPGE